MLLRGRIQEFAQDLLQPDRPWSGSKRVLSNLETKLSAELPTKRAPAWFGQNAQ